VSTASESVDGAPHHAIGGMIEANIAIGSVVEKRVPNLK
jgi:hypothetical protein